MSRATMVARDHLIAARVANIIAANPAGVTVQEIQWRIELPGTSAYMIAKQLKLMQSAGRVERVPVLRGGAVFGWRLVRLAVDNVQGRAGGQTSLPMSTK